MTIITKELISTPRLLVERTNEKAPRTLLEIYLLEVSPSGLRIRYKQDSNSNPTGYWTSVDTFELIEVLENK